MNHKIIEIVEVFYRSSTSPFMVEHSLCRLALPSEEWTRHDILLNSASAGVVSDELLSSIREKEFPAALIERVDRVGRIQMAVFDGGRTLVIEPDPHRGFNWVGHRTVGLHPGLRHGGLNCGLLFMDEWLSRRLDNLDFVEAHDDENGVTSFRFHSKRPSSREYIDISAREREDWYPREIVVSRVPASEDSGPIQREAGAPRVTSTPAVLDRFVIESLQEVDGHKVLECGYSDSPNIGTQSRCRVRVLVSDRESKFRSDAPPDDLKAEGRTLNYQDDLTGESLHFDSDGKRSGAKDGAKGRSSEARKANASVVWLGAVSLLTIVLAFSVFQKGRSNESP